MEWSNDGSCMLLDITCKQDEKRVTFVFKDRFKDPKVDANTGSSLRVYCKLLSCARDPTMTGEAECPEIRTFQMTRGHAKRRFNVVGRWQEL